MSEEPRELNPEELDDEQAVDLPDREAMSIIVGGGSTGGFIPPDPGPIPPYQPMPIQPD